MDFTALVVAELRSFESQMLMNVDFNRKAKHKELAEKSRKLGNDIFTKSKHNAEMHEKIWDCYSASVALSPSGSEILAFAHGNRSALLMHLCKYEDSVKDINEALKITESIPLKVKLLCRKAECLAALGKIEKHDALEKAECWLDKIEAKDDGKEKLVQIFNKTKTVLDKEHVKVSCEQYETEHLRVRDCIETKGILHSVAVHQNEKYGPHFIATEDIKPGELIFVTKPHLIVSNINKFQAYCNNCSGINWSGIPCSNCSFGMFCSEECKREALQKYHDIECLCLQLVITGNGLLDYQIHASLRAVIMGVKEFGSITELRNQVEVIDSYTTDDKRFFGNINFDKDSFKIILSFRNIIVGPAVLNALTKASCRAVIALARYTSFFGENCEFHTIDDILKNKDALFICSLLLRIAIIVFKKGHKVSEGSQLCKNGQDQITCSSSIPCCERGYFLHLTNRFISHSCNPNVRSVMINGGRELWYALQPLKKGDPLLDCYKATFYELDKSIRFPLITSVLNRNCNCIACEENWPAVLAPNGRVITFEDLFKIVIEGALEKEESGKFLILIGENVKYDQTIVNDLTKIMSTAFKCYTQPSQLLCAMICILRYVFDKMHGTKLRIPNECRKT